MSLIVMNCVLLAQVVAEENQSPPIIDVSHQWEVTNIHGPSQVGISDSIAVDLNGDGWMDVVSIGIDDGSIRAYFNHGQAISDPDLNYQQQIIDEDEVGLYRIISTDLNDDGKQDLVTTNIETQQITAYIQQSDGSFINYTVAEGILLPTDVVAGDVNQDGFMDLISISFENNEVYQHLQQAGGTYITSTIAKEVFRPRKLTMTDLNQSGYLDFAVASEEDNSVRVFFNKEGLGWDEQLLTQSATGTRNLTHCDIDNNGLQDLAVSHTGDNELVIYKNFGAWPFTTQIIDNNALGINAILCQDLNNDGQKDIAAIHAQVGNIYSYLQNQDFTPKLVANTRDGYITLAAADFNQIQQPQILTQAHFQQRNLLYSPGLHNDEQVVWQDFPDGAYHLDTGDLNGDGLEDVVYAAFRENKVYWAEQTLNGYVVHMLFDQVDGPQSVSVGDIGHDGDLDVITAGAWDDTFWLHRNDGEGNFTTTAIFAEANNAARSKIIDLNGDGSNDVVITSSLDDSVRWIDLSQGQPVVHLISDEMDGALSFDVEDFDLDGDKDIVIGNFFGNDVSLLKNVNSKFNREILVENLPQPLGVRFYQFFALGSFEILFASNANGELWILENNEKIWYENIVFYSTNGIGHFETVNINLNDYKDLIILTKKDNGVYFSIQNNREFSDVFVSSVNIQDSFIKAEFHGYRKFYLNNKLKNQIRKQGYLDFIFKSDFD